MYELWTDGSILRNHNNIGGWAFLFRHDNKIIKKSGGVLNTTGNRMEMFSVIKGLAFMEECGFVHQKIKVLSDSQYVVNGANEHIYKWLRNNWVTANNTPVKNKDLWDFLSEFISYFPFLEWEWVRGHSGIEYNEIVDKMARDAANQFIRVMTY